MKVILLEDIKSLGKKGDVVDVSDGYAKNFLLTKKKGVEANSRNLNDLKLKKANDEKVAAQNLQDAKDLAASLEEKTVVVRLKAGEGGKTFGSVSSKEIAEEAKLQHGLDIDKKKIVINDPIKSLGTYEVTIKLHPKVSGKLKVKVEEE
ncbi:MAG TPA: 50S ribosomal protein L9 [Lachnospiraceae bacterium]|nr:50S ribosomal protein L9 [Lachnospiraceae bacterium]